MISKVVRGRASFEGVVDTIIRSTGGGVLAYNVVDDQGILWHRTHFELLEDVPNEEV